MLVILKLNAMEYETDKYGWSPFLPVDVVLDVPSKWYYELEVYDANPKKRRLKFVKEIKPCYIGDKIHVNSRNGIYRVSNVTLQYIILQTKHQKYRTTWNNFKCLAGGGKNL